MVLSRLKPTSIALIKPSALGDIVQSLPIAHALKQAFPTARLTWIVNRSYADLIRPISLIDQVIEFDRSALKRSFRQGLHTNWQFFSRLRRERFDLVIDLQGLLRTGMMTWATRAPVRIGLKSAREGSRLAYTHLADDAPAEQNAVSRYWSVAKLLGIDHQPITFPLELSSDEISRAHSLIGGMPRPLIALNPGARWITKRWPAESFAQLAHRFQQTFGGSQILVGGPGEEEIGTQVTNELVRLQSTSAESAIPNFVGKTSLRELAALLAQCDWVLSNDTGPLHLAAALGVKTFALYTCTSPIRSGAFGNCQHHVATDVECKASYIKECSHLSCMQQLTPNLAWEAFEPLARQG